MSCREKRNFSLNLNCWTQAGKLKVFSLTGSGIEQRSTASQSELNFGFSPFIVILTYVHCNTDLLFIEILTYVFCRCFCGVCFFCSIFLIFWCLVLVMRWQLTSTLHCNNFNFNTTSTLHCNTKRARSTPQWSRPVIGQLYAEF